MTQNIFSLAPDKVPFQLEISINFLEAYVVNLFTHFFFSSIATEPLFYSTFLKALYPSKKPPQKFW